MNGKLHIVWDMDGTLVDSEPEIVATIEESLASAGISIADAQAPIRIGPPVRNILRTAFPEDVLTETQFDEVVKAFRTIYDTSDYRNTKPYEGIDVIIRDPRYVHHVITNKPDLPTNRIIDSKGWRDYIADVLTPNTMEQQVGRLLTKPELFQLFRKQHPAEWTIGIGDMASDSEAAQAVGMDAIGVLWGTGTYEELELSGCYYIVSSVQELKELLNHLDTNK